MTYEDRDGKQIVDGSIIDIHQSVNGQSKFIVLSLSPLDVRYEYDYNRRYEYDMDSLLGFDPICGTTDIEIVGNLNDNIRKTLNQNKMKLTHVQEKQLIDIINAIVSEFNITERNVIHSLRVAKNFYTNKFNPYRFIFNYNTEEYEAIIRDALRFSGIRYTHPNNEHRKIKHIHRVAKNRILDMLNSFDDNSLTQSRLSKKYTYLNEYPIEVFIGRIPCNYKHIQYELSPTMKSNIFGKYKSVTIDVHKVRYNGKVITIIPKSISEYSYVTELKLTPSELFLLKFKR